MSTSKAHRAAFFLPAAILFCISLCWNASEAQAQFFATSSVAGVHIDANGVVTQMALGDIAKLRKLRVKDFDKVPAELGEGVQLRKISLRQLQEEIRATGIQDITKLPDHLRYMAGLQRVQFIFVYPEQNDIVLVGPSESWEVNKSGNVVGETSGRPVIHLEDLASVLRFTFAPQREVITCSIDPTAEGIQRYQKANQERLDKKIKGKRAEKLLKDAMGQYDVTIGGIDPESRFARVIFGADYRMKRLAMGIDKSPIKGLPSFLSMVKSRNVKNISPRFWLEDNYETLLTDGEDLSWELRGSGVKAVTEEELVDSEGNRTGTGTTNPLAKRWTDNMTKHYDKLAAKDTVFGELRNCMDMAVVSALIASEKLHERAGLDLSLLLDKESLQLPRYRAASNVPAITSQIQRRKFSAITTSGGVMLNAWNVAQRQETDKSIGKGRTEAKATDKSAWSWN